MEEHALDSTRKSFYNIDRRIDEEVIKIKNDIYMLKNDDTLNLTYNSFESTNASNYLKIMGKLKTLKAGSNYIDDVFIYNVKNNFSLPLEVLKT